MSAAPASGAQPAPSRRWIGVPRLRGRLTAADVGLLVNTADPYSVAVGEHYVRARGMRPEQVLNVELPRRATLEPAEFEALRRAIEAHFGPRTQALVLAWVAPYAVACNAITGALALGLDLGLCANGCARSRTSGWFNSASHRPLQEPGWRPSMLLAAPSVEAAKSLIDRGVAADGSLMRPPDPPAQVLLLDGPDAARQVRTRLYPPGPLAAGRGVVWLEAPATEALPGARRLLIAITGSEQLPLQPPPQWLPGGLGDHLTSWGGDLLGAHGQATAMEWIASGATASHGAVSEPCNHLQKFPHPQVLMGHYLQGATALEAYWRSVAWPQQSLFIGEPLAAPFAPPASPPVTPPPPPAPAARPPVP
ncbi:MAG: TIGR03790 family protein [Betaproteobacteria bacterium]